VKEAIEGRAQRGPVGAPVKLGIPESIDESWLRDFDHERSEYLIRLENDRSIIAELRDAGFDGAHYTYFTSELAKYGIAVLTAWIRTQQIFEKMRLRGLGGLPPAPGELLRDQEAAQELAMETVAHAIVNFRVYVLIPGKWDPDRGASIRTYFIGQCLIQFANVYRRWLRETIDRAPYDALQNDAVMDARGYEHVEERVAEIVSVDVLLGTVKKDRTKSILVLRGAGYTQEEIADRLGVTLKAVETTIAYERKKQMKGTG